MKILHILGMTVALGTTWVAASARPGDTIGQSVSLTSGIVETTPRNDEGVLGFKGIPYAAAPIGALRWEPPHAAVPWSEPLDASRFGASCASSGNAPGPHSEDCLTINIWTPAKAQHEQLPVIVWIPGGGFQSSDSSRPNVDGAKLAAKGAVLVSFNYRVGVFGFLAHPGLDRPGAPSGNYGLEDQIAALRWVRDNIRRFGGNPGNVTIAGESTGGMSVAMLMTSPQARGLFHKAIGESHGFWDTVHGSILSHAEAVARAEALEARLTGGDIDALKALPADTVSAQAAAKGGPTDFLLQGFSPSVDGAVLPDAPAAVFARGDQAHVPLLVGFNDAEGATFARFARMPTTVAAYRGALEQWLGKGGSAEAMRYYPAETDRDVPRAIEQLFGDVDSKEQTWEWMRLHARTSHAQVYGYLFAMRSGYTPVPAHTAEIDYVFGTLQKHWLAPTGGLPQAEDRNLADQMMRYWTNFARTGDPNGKELPSWPVYKLADPRILRLDAHPRSATERADSLRFLSRLRIDGRFPASWRTNNLGL